MTSKAAKIISRILLLLLVSLLVRSVFLEIKRFNLEAVHTSSAMMNMG